MERLTFKGDGCVHFYRKSIDVTNTQLFDRLGEYEDLEEQGKLIKLPCAIGDTVYCIFTSMKGTNPVIFTQKFNYGMIEGFGKTVFLTKEDAETALQKMKESEESDNE